MPLITDLDWSVNPLSPNINISVLLSVPHMFLYGTSWENLHKHNTFHVW